MRARIKIKLSRRIREALGVVFAILLTLFLTISGIINIDYLEAFTYDLRLSWRSGRSPSPQIRLVMIDSQTLSQLGGYPTLSDHLKLLEILRGNEPRAVLYSFSPLRILGPVADSHLFVLSSQKLKNFMVASPELPVTPQWERHKLPPPFEELLYVPAPLATDQRSFAKDNLTRRQALSFEGRSLLNYRLAQILKPDIQPVENLRGAYELQLTWQLYTDYLPVRSYERISFARLLQNPQIAKDWRHGLVIVGIDTEDDSSDYVQTPMTKGRIDMTAAEMHANQVDTLLRNSAPLQMPLWLNQLLTLLFAYFTLTVALKMRPGRGLALLGAMTATYVIFCVSLFSINGIWLPMAAPLVATFIAYYLFIPYRLIIENRRSWEYLQRNRILTQVEELKTNFVSMMSHDLKTPLARIQGMTDLIARDDNPLSPQQADALLSIQKSTEELGNFISSILDLGRIESQQIKLQLVSRDVNALLEEVIRRHDFLAKQKNITIIKEFEPLFSVRIDVELMGQVFSNLLENAIKYSRSGGRVLVSSEEMPGQDQIIVQFADQGDGIPPEDLPHIFLKFYRSRDARISTIRGSGLGLYLAKYFVELHNGSIGVDSTPGLGTTFTVVLPVNTTAS